MCPPPPHSRFVSQSVSYAQFLYPTNALVRQKPSSTSDLTLQIPVSRSTHSMPGRSYHPSRLNSAVGLDLGNTHTHTGPCVRFSCHQVTKRLTVTYVHCTCMCMLFCYFCFNMQHLQFSTLMNWTTTIILIYQLSQILWQTCFIVSIVKCSNHYSTVHI